jgi:hypothetical protein
MRALLRERKVSPDGQERAKRHRSGTGQRMMLLAFRETSRVALQFTARLFFDIVDKDFGQSVRMAYLARKVFAALVQGPTKSGVTFAIARSVITKTLP